MIFPIRSKVFIIFITGLLISIFSCSMLRAREMHTDDLSEIQSDSPGEKILTLSLEDAVLLALKRNRDLKVKIMEPQIKQTLVEEKEAVFDVNVDLQFHIEKYNDSIHWTKEDSKSDLLSRFPNLPESIFDDMPEEIETENSFQKDNGSIGFTKLFSTGTELNLELKSERLDKETIRSSFDEGSTSTTEATSTTYVSSGSLKLTQPLWQGRGKKIGLSLVELSEIDRQISVYELQHYVTELIVEVQKKYWDLVLSKETLNIRQKSLELVNRQLAETEERIRIGKESESELVTAQAEVAAEKEKLIDAISDMAKKKLDFILFLNPEDDILWDQNIQLITPPKPIEKKIGTIQHHVANSLRLRPDLNQARLKLQKGDIEVVRTQNGLLPKLDFIFTLKTLATGSEFPSSLDEFDNPHYTAGLILSHPIGQRAAKSQFLKTNLERVQYLQSMEYLKQKIQVEVRQAILEIERYREQILASRANRKKQDEKLKVEREKFRLGRSTNLLVFHAQRDLIEAEVKEIKAIIEQIKAFINLQKVEGTLLDHWSVDVVPPLSPPLVYSPHEP